MKRNSEIEKSKRNKFLLVVSCAVLFVLLSVSSSYADTTDEDYWWNRGFPDIEPIRYGKASYELGDEVTVILTGIPNPNGNNFIDGFTIWIKYGKSGTNYVSGYDGRYVKANGGTALVTFIPAMKGLIEVEANSWDGDSSYDSNFPHGKMSNIITGEVYINYAMPNNNQDNDVSSSEESDDNSRTPGFEYISLIVAISIVGLIIRYRRYK